jgi:PD-(D/E)XK nuclease superfamily
VNVELATGNYLKPNELGGYHVSASGLTAWSRCQLQRFYELRARSEPDQPQPRALSATVYGSVMHYALMILERLHHEGDANALPTAITTFETYWHPDNTRSLIGEVVEDWLPRQTYAGLKERGRLALTDYYKLLCRDDGKLLALEYPFEVPIQVGDRTHTMTGAIDRMALRKYYNKPYISLEDYKTGRQASWLRWHIQGTVYSWVTTQEAFWAGFPEETVEALQRTFTTYGYDMIPGGRRQTASRRFRWINIQELRIVDGGWRTDTDYARMVLAIDAYVRGCEAGIYAVNTDGSVCRFCDFRTTCAGTGLPAEKSGAP